jgi:hypothetical protein
MLQLGCSETKPYSEMATMSTLAFLMRLSTSEGRDALQVDVGPSDRSPLPVLPLCKFSETRHFGGALQEDRKLPKNYTSVTSHVDSERAPFNLLTRVFMSSLERGVLAKNVFDMTYVLAANEQDELPERAMCSLRAVHVHPNDVALPSVFVWGSHRRQRPQRNRRATDKNFFRSVMGNITMIGERLRLIDYDDEDDQRRPRTSSGDSQMVVDQSQLESRRIVVVASQDPIEKSVNELVEILDNVKIPIRKDQLSMYDFASSIPMSLLHTYSFGSGESHKKDLLNMSLLLLITRGEIRRHFIASGCNLRKAAIRIVESAAWRGHTFPIDTRMCRVELQSGQFFQQGKDILGNPVFYFRNMGLGPWRKDFDASVAAVLHRLESALRVFAKEEEDVKCTLIIIMGKPYRFKKRRKHGGGADGASVAGGDEDDYDDGDSMMSESLREFSEDDDHRVANPRVNPEESWQSHTNKRLAKQLVDLVSAYYPERLHRALVVANQNQLINLNKLMGSFTLGSFVDSTSTKQKVKFLSKFSELQNYVKKQELVTIAGGTQPIDPSVFELTS